MRHLTSRPAGRAGKFSAGALASGAVATGAFAVGALAVGALAIGRLAVRKSHFGRLSIDELVIAGKPVGELPLKASSTTLSIPGPVRVTVNVPASVDRAFAFFTDSFSSWWPREYTWSQDALNRIGIEAREGGLCSEYGPNGFRCDWGRVLVWDPPQQLVLSWQLSPDRQPEPNPAKASEVDIRFLPQGDSSCVLELQHRGFERHGAGGGAYAAAMGSDEGWPKILHRYRMSIG
jgi:uncharacterized protein YndB with AHSA1/START domain